MQRDAQEKLHNKIRQVVVNWKSSRSIVSQQPEENSRPPTAAEDKEDEEGEKNKEGEEEEEEFVLKDFATADEEQIQKILEQDSSHVDTLNEVVADLKKKSDMLEELRRRFDEAQDENERLQKLTKDYVDPSVLNELDGMRKELSNRERLVADLQNSISEKKAEVDDMNSRLGEAEQRLSRSEGDTAAELLASRERLASDMEQLNAMRSAQEASEKTSGMLRNRIRELELRETQFKRQIDELMRKEQAFEGEMNALLEARKADEFALAELEKQLSMALDGDGKLRLEALRRRRQKKLKGYSNMIEDLIKKREENLLEVMKSYKWIHHVPQVVFNGVPYSSLVEWAETKR